MTQDPHSLTGPYALNALPPEEAAAFEAHLKECDDCRVELVAFRETAARLAETSAVTPPAGMKASVMAQIAVTRQDAPEVTALPQLDLSLRGRRRPAAFSLAPMAAMAAAIALVVALGVATTSLTGRVNDLENRERTLAAVLASSDVAVAHGQGAGADAAIVASAELGQAVVTFANLDAAPRDHVYELWMIGDDGPVPAGLFHVDANGRAIAVMEGNVANTHTIAVTIEPSGGSDMPTTAPFLTLVLDT